MGAGERRAMEVDGVGVCLNVSQKNKLSPPPIQGIVQKGFLRTESRKTTVLLSNSFDPKCALGYLFYVFLRDQNISGATSICLSYARECCSEPSSQLKLLDGMWSLQRVVGIPWTGWSSAHQQHSLSAPRVFHQESYLHAFQS